ncbi:MAG TPA: urea ABC transporter ATP-binding subunit UrtE [Candidatus Sulfotelmatobacter sp.]|nr:urea ABC transporter ATP-binding subunit UrtE [Candidatus Sulfotelmatobacter sp.]
MLALEGVGAAYGLSQVLSDVALQVEAGEAVALLGRNGVGKTTLLRTIVGLHPASSGHVRLGARELTRVPSFRRARAGIGYVPQGRGIFPHLTVEENLRLGATARTGRGAPRSVTLDEVYLLFPALERLRARAGGVLSGGEQQQVALGRALLGEPQVLLLDEPTEGIQPSIVAEIEEALREIRRERGIAVLLVEQHLDFAWSVADRYYVMQRGTVVRSGTTATDAPEEVAPLLSV